MMYQVPTDPPRPPRVLVYLPSWVGDTVMATPTLALLRAALPKSIIITLGRPGAAELLAGLDHLNDETIESDGRSAVGPAKVATRLRAMRIDAALVLPNSFASALAVSLASIKTRVGYDRDGRGLLLTHKLTAQKRRSPPWAREGGYAPVSAVEYYLNAAHALIQALGVPTPDQPPTLTLGTTRGQEHLADDVLDRAGITKDQPFALLNPGGNNPAKRWPVERFAVIAHHLITTHKMKVLINGSPGERDLCALIQRTITLNHPADESMVASTADLGGTIGALKAITRRARVMLTNDTGPRHIAAAMGTRCVTLFGPTDPRWTTLPESFTSPGVPREVCILADPTLPPSEVADDHPERCRIEHINTQDVINALDRVLA